MLYDCVNILYLRVAQSTCTNESFLALCIQFHDGGCHVPLSRSFIKLMWYKKRRTKILQLLGIDINSHSHYIGTCLLIRAESIRSAFTDVKPITLDKKGNEAPMRDEGNIAVRLREPLQAPSNRLRACSRAVNAVWRVMPFLPTLRKVEPREPGPHLRPRDALVAGGIAGFAQIGPDLHFGLERWGRADEDGRERIHGGLDGARHGRDYDEVGNGGDSDSLGGGESFVGQGRVSMGVAAVDVVEGLSVADDMD